MPELDLKMPCQRCGDAMELKDPAPGAPWRPDQFWVCARCGRHFWTTYANPPVKAVPAPLTTPTPPDVASS